MQTIQQMQQEIIMAQVLELFKIQEQLHSRTVLFMEHTQVLELQVLYM